MDEIVIISQKCRLICRKVEKT